MPDTIPVDSPSSPQDFILNLNPLLTSNNIAASASPSVLCPDLRKQVRDCLLPADSALSSLQADHVITALWSLALAMVDLAYRSSPADQALATRKRERGGCGQVPQKTPAKCDKIAASVLPSDHSDTDKDSDARAAFSPTRVRGES